MKSAKPLAFVLLAFLIGGIASQLPFAFADSSSTNPLQSIWDAVGALNTKQQDLQAQIDELRAEIQEKKSSAAPSEVVTLEGDLSIKIEVESAQGENDIEGTERTVLFHLIASNSGPESVVGVKLTIFYKLGLFEIRSITAVTGQQCQESSRGIIQCYIGTIEPSSERRITLTAAAKAPDNAAHIVADISSITKDTDPTNNHADVTFVPSELIISSQEQYNNNSIERQSQAIGSDKNNTQSEEEKPPQNSTTDNNNAGNVTQEQPAENDTQQADQSDANSQDNVPAQNSDDNSKEQNSSQNESSNDNSPQDGGGNTNSEG